jgi:hypothetical protein
MVALADNGTAGRPGTTPVQGALSGDSQQIPGICYDRGPERIGGSPKSEDAMRQFRKWSNRPVAAGLCLCLALFAAPAIAQNCSRISVGFLPLTDLGANSYQGKQGGLYPGGSNSRPAGHEAAGLAAARGIRPLDARGVLDETGGRIVLISVGMSNTTQEFSTFKPLASADPGKNPRLSIVDGAQGGMTARIIADLTNPSGQRYWETVDARLAASGVTPAQVQVAWVKEADAQPTAQFPNDALLLKNELAAIARILKVRYPNIRIAYFSSRIYGGYASTALNPEPFAYQSGFAVKWLIEDQISGSSDLNFIPEAGAVMAPWLAWGPYLWADGLTPRSDGLIYKCSDFNPSDGTHPATPGAREKVAEMLLQFFTTDGTAKIWFARGASLIFPALVSREHSLAAPGRRALTGIGVANLDTAAATLTFTAFDKTGATIKGAGIQNPKILPLAAGQQMPRLDFQVFGDGIAAGEQAGWFRVDSTIAKVTGFFLLFDDEVSVLDGINASCFGIRSFLLPDLGDAAEFSQVQVVNAGNDPAEVTFNLVDSSGDTGIPAAIRTIAAKGMLTERLLDLFPGGLATSAYLRATSDREVVPLLLWGSRGQVLKALEGQDTQNGAATLYSPQYAVGGNWSTTLSVVNLDGRQAEIQFEFNDRTGSSISRRLTIAPHGKLFIEDQSFFVDPGANPREGYVKITSGGALLAGSVVFGDPRRQNMASALPMVSKLQNEVVFCQLASDATYYTGIALLNPGSSDASITVEVYDSNGIPLANEAGVLARQSSTAYDLSILPGLKGLQISSGYIKVKADQPIAGFALFGTHNNTALSAIPPQPVR